MNENQVILSRLDTNSLKINQLNQIINFLIGELAKLKGVEFDTLLNETIEDVNKSFTVEGISQITYYNC